MLIHPAVSFCSFVLQKKQRPPFHRLTAAEQPAPVSEGWMHNHFTYETPDSHQS